ncbi:alpha/beta hydrolase [soil metagenome]
MSPVETLLPGITAARVRTGRLTVNVLSTGSGDGEPVLFVHGNVSSALFWQQTMLSLPQRFRPLAVDLRGFGDTDPIPLDATRGLADYSDDVAGLLAALELPEVHLVGWSMGGGVALQLLLEHPHLFRTLTLVNPLSPYGFGGTTGPDGDLTCRDGAGSGAGAANAEFVALLAAGDTGTEHQASPRNVLRAFYVAPPMVPDLEDIYVASMLSTCTGEQHYPGDVSPSEHWPGVAPGTSGVLHAMAPVYYNTTRIVDLESKPPILWIRGGADQIISDTSMFDLATLGQLEVVPGWPGPETHAPQPMLAQTRAVLDSYAQRGGRYREIALPGVGHSPHIEAPAEFQAALLAHLG